MPPTSVAAGRETLGWFGSCAVGDGAGGIGLTKPELLGTNGWLYCAAKLKVDGPTYDSVPNLRGPPGPPFCLSASSRTSSPGSRPASTAPRLTAVGAGLGAEVEEEEVSSGALPPITP